MKGFDCREAILIDNGEDGQDPGGGPSGRALVWGGTPSAPLDSWSSERLARSIPKGSASASTTTSRPAGALRRGGVGGPPNSRHDAMPAVMRLEITRLELRSAA